MARNPPWSRDELLLALDLYLRHRKNIPSQDHEEVVRLSKELVALGGAMGSQFQNFRNPNGVYMKLANFQALDPIYTSVGKKGLARGGKR